MNIESKRNLQIHHEAILSVVGIVGGGFGLLSSGVVTAGMIINGPERVIETIEEVYNGYKLDVFADLTHYALAAGIPLPVAEGGIMVTSLALLADGIFRYREGRRRFDHK